MTDDVYDKLQEMSGFEWDMWNGEKNRIKHEVLTKECEEIFFNKPLAIIPDTKHSFVEARYAGLGITDMGRFLTVIFTFRGTLMRVISARDQSTKERTFFILRSKLGIH